MEFITAENLKHSFVRLDEEGEPIGEFSALNGIDLEIRAGQFIAVLGQNGSGKTTFARHINALLTPTEGTLYVDGRNTKEEDLLWEIRRTAGMIFQNPDNQIVAGVVEEDVAFGPENIGLPTEEIEERVDTALSTVDMEAYRRQSPEKLSGGQKQRVAVAGVVAMEPKCILMDEPTAMLDPDGRKEVMETAHRLNRTEKVTVILITHFMEEAAQADYVFVMDEGKIAMQGTPREIFAREEELGRHGLVLPQIARLACELKADGIPLPDGILSREELTDALCAGVLGKEQGRGAENEKTSPMPGNNAGTGKEKLRLEGVSYSYSPGTVFETKALKEIDLSFFEGEMIGLIGPTGSGKSTLIQLLNGLLQPTAGHVYYEEQDVNASDAKAAGLSKKELRAKVGLVFQFAESQLFESTVLKDAAYGPKNLGLPEDEACEKAKKALSQMGLGEDFWEMSPFDLSGGQRRRAAIAGVIAMEPSVLILDEPTAGLDPKGKEELFDLIRSLHSKRNLTVLIVSHDMEDMADLAERIVVLKEGGVLFDGTPAEVFRHMRELEEAHLDVPQVTGLMNDLSGKGYPVDLSAVTVDAAKREIEKLC